MRSICTAKAPQIFSAKMAVFVCIIQLENYVTCNTGLRIRRNEDKSCWKDGKKETINTKLNFYSDIKIFNRDTVKSKTYGADKLIFSYFISFKLAITISD